MLIFFFKQKTAYEMLRSLVGSEMCIRDSEILTGAPAGEKDEEGNYPPGSINYLVAKRLVQMAERSKRFGEAEKEEEARD